MSSIFRIVHVSDLHIRPKRLPEFRDRREALFSDIQQNYTPVDIMVVSGDIAFSGGSDEYALAKEEFFEPAQRNLHLGRGKILVVPGNHDVDRSKIDPMTENGLQNRLRESPKEVESIILNPVYARDHMLPFFEATKEHSGWGDRICATAKAIQAGVSIGFGLMNSAWRCGGDATEGTLFLSNHQLETTLGEIKECAIRIGVIHHPVEWFSQVESNGPCFNHLHRQFHIVLTGHLHENHSSSVMTPTSECVFLTAPAFFDGHSPAISDGYNIYDLDLERTKITCKYRKYIEKRQSFDANVDHAQGGEWIPDLPVKSFLVQSGSNFLPQRIAAVCSELQSRIQKQLSLSQDREDPVFVPPRVLQVSWKSGHAKDTPIGNWTKHISGNPCVIYGPAEVGKTLLLETVAAECANSEDLPFCLYLDIHEMNWDRSKGETLGDLLDREFKSRELGGTLAGTTVLLDHLAISENVLKQVVSMQKDQGICVSFTVDDSLLFDTLCNDERFSAFEKLKIPYWGPSRIREFVRCFFREGTIDIEAACGFIERILKQCDLPLTPTIVAMYVGVFPSLGNELTGLSFVRLLERIEQQRLDNRTEKSSSYSFYNRQQVLVKLAGYMCSQRQTFIGSGEMNSLVLEYFGRSNLEVDEERFVDQILQTGILRKEGDQIDFGCFVFFDYYLALAMARGVLPVKEYLASLDSTIPICQALGIYAGIKRDNRGLVEDVFWLINEAFGGHGVVDLDGLDAHIKFLVEPQHSADEADKIVTHDLQSRIDEEEREAEFEESRAVEKASRSVLRQDADGKLSISRLGRLIMSLKVFYNIFRNMENIEGSYKEDFLDNILAFHIQCNMELINYFHSLVDDDDFRTLTAYGFTIGGQAFLCAEMGTQSLKVTIEKCIDSCTNDFKLFLLLCLYADFRFSGYAKRLNDFLEKTTSHAAVEMIYLKARRLIVEYEGKNVPIPLLGLFQQAFESRQRFYGRVSSIKLGEMKSRAIQEAERERTIHSQMKKST